MALPSAAAALCGAMTLAQNPAIVTHNRDATYPPVFEFQQKSFPDQVARINADPPFNSVKTGNRQAGLFHHSLITADAINDLANRFPVLHQLAGAVAFFDKLHHIHYAPQHNFNENQRG